MPDGESGARCHSTLLPLSRLRMLASPRHNTNANAAPSPATMATVRARVCSSPLSALPVTVGEVVVGVAIATLVAAGILEGTGVESGVEVEITAGVAVAMTIVGFGVLVAVACGYV